MSTDAPRQAYAHPVRLIIVLAIAPAIGLMTVSFGTGQTLGPIAIGAITDAMGKLSYALSVSAAVLVAGVAACLAYAAFRRDPAPESRIAGSFPTQTGSRV
jgi:biopolymer transport protein ExbB/TolQ